MEDNKMEEKINIVLSLLKKITDDGEITEEEVNELRKYLLNEDGSYNINRKVADGLFNLLNTAKNKEVVDDSFGKLFIDAVSAYLLKDKSSTGVLDDKEVDWLVGKIESDLDIDDTVFALVQELKEKSYNKFPKKLYSAIILYRLRGIQKMLSEPNNAGEGLFYKIVEKLNECVKERDKLYIDDKCILALFSIKDQLSRKKLLQLPDDRSGRTAQKTSESLTDQFINVFCELVSANVLYDANSPYIVDKSEADKLKRIINHKTSVDYIDKVLLDELESRSMYFPEVLAKVRFGYETARVRLTVIKALLEKKDVDEAKDGLKKYLNITFECRDEHKIKAQLLFDLKNLTKIQEYKEGAPEEETDIECFIQKKFVEQVAYFIVGEGSQSPNEIDDEDEKWLKERLEVSGSRYYECDEDLLKHLKQSSVNFPKSLEERLSRVILKRKLRELKKQENVLSEKDLKELEEAIFDDNEEFKIDPKEAAESVFKIKDNVYKKEKKRNNELSDFFVKVVSLYLLGDKQSPGKIDDAETEWLLAKININGETDEYDKALLKSLEKTSINHPNVLHYIGRWKNSFRQTLYFSRKICWIAILSCAIASIFLFVKGAAHVGSGIFAQFGNIKSEEAFVEIVEGIDSFLVALVVFILGIGIFELFIRKLEKPYKVNEKRPSWMQMNSIDDLKSSLVKMLIIAMIVGFYKMTLTSPLDKNSLLALAIGIVLIAIAFCVTEISAHYHHKSKIEDFKVEKNKHKSGEIKEEK